MKRKINHQQFQRISTKYSLKENQDKVLDNFDLFLSCSGFEERTTGFIQKLTKKTKIDNFAIFLYHPQEENIYIKNLQNLGKFRNATKDLEIKNEQVIHIDPTNPWEFKKTLNLLFQKHKINENSRILLDITSFTRVFLYEIINVLYKTSCSFTITYTEPENYVEILPSGINNIIISPSFSGKSRPSKKSFLMILFGWETGRTLGVYDNYNSDEQVGVVGVEPIDEKHVDWEEKSRERNEELINIMNPIETCPTLDLEKIIQFINKIYVEKEKSYISKNLKFSFGISGLGPKIQNLAACIVALKKKDIQLIYGAPAYWGSSTNISIEKPIESYGIGETYVYGPFSKKYIDDLN